MSTRITDDEGKVALFDSSTGFAFGPVFDSNSDADAFLEWLGKGEEEGRTFHEGRTRFIADPRKYRSRELQELVSLWQAELIEA